MGEILHNPQILFEKTYMEIVLIVFDGSNVLGYKVPTAQSHKNIPILQALSRTITPTNLAQWDKASERMIWSFHLWLKALLVRHLGSARPLGMTSSAAQMRPFIPRGLSST